MRVPRSLALQAHTAAMSRHSHQSSFATEAKALLATAAAAEKEWADASASNKEACTTLPTPAYGEFDYECCNSWAGQDQARTRSAESTRAARALQNVQAAPRTPKSLTPKRIW